MTDYPEGQALVNLWATMVDYWQNQIPSAAENITNIADSPI